MANMSPVAATMAVRTLTQGANLFILDEGRAWRQTEGGREPVSAMEFWVANQNEIIFSDIELLGLAGFKVSVEVDESIRFKLQLRTEVGLIDAPKNIDSTWDSCFVGKYWIPIKPADLSAVWGAAKEASIEFDKRSSKKQLFAFIKSCTKWGVSLDLPGNLGDFFSIAPEISSLNLLRGEPYEYQRVGINWLCDYYENSLGALLCDEMGLGKTYQVLGLVAHVFSKTSKQILITCPATLVANWTNEMSKFLPEIKPYVHFGSVRTLDKELFQVHKVVIASYDLVVRDIALFANTSWGLVVCDEAQALKNRKSQRHEAICRLDCQTKYLVTGTPVENSLTDLWALSNIVFPGLLGEAEDFESLIDDTPAEAHKLSTFIAPLILRRLVSEVAPDLPELVEIDEPLFPSSEFAKAYEAVREGIDGHEVGKNFLAVQMRLTQMCCYPGTYLETYRDNKDTKFARLAEILDELNYKNSDKVLIFTTFTKSIDMLVNFIGLRYGRQKVRNLDGRGKTSERQELVDSFNDEAGFQVLVVNPKAGGSGLNITGANHVIHFNRQWNPQLESQATARAYRRKQEKTVFVHKFYYLGTIEQVISERLKRKASLAEAALSESLAEEEVIFRSKALLVSAAKYV
jgi:SNF2 family DNA or RNA helicase